MRGAKRYLGVTLNFAPFVLMLYLCFFYREGGIELKFTTLFLTCNYYFARAVYLSKRHE